MILARGCLAHVPRCTPAAAAQIVKSDNELVKRNRAMQPLGRHNAILILESLVQSLFPLLHASGELALGDVDAFQGVSYAGYVSMVAAMDACANIFTGVCTGIVTSNTIERYYLRSNSGFTVSSAYTSFRLDDAPCDPINPEVDPPSFSHPKGRGVRVSMTPTSAKAACRRRCY